MAYTAPNIDAVLIEFEPYTAPADLTAIAIGFGDEPVGPINPDWREATPYQKVTGAWVAKAGRRKVDGIWRTGTWYRNVNPDTVAPTNADSTIVLASETDTSFTVQYTKCTDARTDQTALVYRLYTADVPLTTLADVDGFGTLSGTGTDVDTLTATGLSNGESYYYTVTCSDLAGNRFKYDAGQTTLIQEGFDSFDIIDDNFFIESGDTRQVLFNILVIGDITDEVVWTSSDVAILTVDAAGIVTGVSGPAEATLTGTPTANPAAAQSILIGVDTFDFGTYTAPQSFTTIAL